MAREPRCRPAERRRRHWTKRRCGRTPGAAGGRLRRRQTDARSWAHLRAGGGGQPRGGTPQIRLRVEVTLHSVVERTLGVEELEQRGTARAVHVRGDLT